MMWELMFCSLIGNIMIIIVLAAMLRSRDKIMHEMVDLVGVAIRLAQALREPAPSEVPTTNRSDGEINSTEGADIG